MTESSTTAAVNETATLVATDTQENDPATGTKSDNSPMANEVNRELPVACTVSHRVYSAPSHFDDVDFLDDVELVECPRGLTVPGLNKKTSYRGTRQMSC